MILEARASSRQRHGTVLAFFDGWIVCLEGKKWCSGK